VGGDRGAGPRARLNAGPHAGASSGTGARRSGRKRHQQPDREELEIEVEQAGLREAIAIDAVSPVERIPPTQAYPSGAWIATW